MAILPIRIYPDPVLRMKCRDVTEFDEKLRKTAADMIETMHAAPGVGLAAPQVGLDVRLAVIDLSVGEDPKQVHVVVNPEVTAREGAETAEEGCLSLPGITDKVERPTLVTVKAQELSGRPIEIRAEGWLARAFCHEIDHLNGVLFVDYLRGLRKERVRRQLKRLAAGVEATA